MPVAAEVEAAIETKKAELREATAKAQSDSADYRKACDVKSGEIADLQSELDQLTSQPQPASGDSLAKLAKEKHEEMRQRWQSVKTVDQLLRKLDMEKVESYIELFREHEIDLAVLLACTREASKFDAMCDRIGVKAVGARMKIQYATDELNELRGEDTSFLAIIHDLQPSESSTPSSDPEEPTVATAPAVPARTGPTAAIPWSTDEEMYVFNFADQAKHQGVDLTKVSDWEGIAKDFRQQFPGIIRSAAGIKAKVARESRKGATGSRSFEASSTASSSSTAHAALDDALIPSSVNVTVRHSSTWSTAEGEKLMRIVEDNPEVDWGQIAKSLGGRSEGACKKKFKSLTQAQGTQSIYGCFFADSDESRKGATRGLSRSFDASSTASSSSTTHAALDDALIPSSVNVTVRHSSTWSTAEGEKLLRIVEDNPEVDWGQIAKSLGGRSEGACRKKFKSLTQAQGTQSIADSESDNDEPDEAEGHRRSPFTLWDPKQEAVLSKLKLNHHGGWDDLVELFFKDTGIRRTNKSLRDKWTSMKQREEAASKQTAKQLKQREKAASEKAKQQQVKATLGSAQEPEQTVTKKADFDDKALLLQDIKIAASKCKKQETKNSARYTNIKRAVAVAKKLFEQKLRLTRTNLYSCCEKKRDASGRKQHPKTGLDLILKALDDHPISPADRDDWIKKQQPEVPAQVNYFNLSKKATTTDATPVRQPFHSLATTGDGQGEEARVGDSSGDTAPSSADETKVRRRIDVSVKTEENTETEWPRVAFTKRAMNGNARLSSSGEQPMEKDVKMDRGSQRHTPQLRGTQMETSAGAAEAEDLKARHQYMLEYNAPAQHPTAAAAKRASNWGVHQQPASPGTSTNGDNQRPSKKSRLDRSPDSASAATNKQPEVIDLTLDDDIELINQ